MTKFYADYSLYQKIRDEKGLTDYAVSVGTGVATATLSNWKSGEYNPKLEKLIAIANFLGVDLMDLVSEKKEEEANDQK